MLHLLGVFNALAATPAVNPSVTTASYTAPAGGTPATIAQTLDYTDLGGTDTLTAYGVTSTSATPPSKAEIAAGTGTGSLEEFSFAVTASGDTDTISGLTATSEPATHIHYYVAEDTNGGSSAIVTLAVSGLDFTAPAFNGAGSTPADGAATFDGTSDIVLDFSEAIFAGTGSVSIYDAADDSLVQAIAIGSASIASDKATFAFSDLPLGSYYAQWPAGLVTDIAGNPCAAVADETTFNFTVAVAGTPPAFQAAGTPGQNTAVWPTHQSGDLGILAVCQRGDNTAMSTPTDWVSLGSWETGAGTADARLQLFRRFATSASEANVTGLSPTNDAAQGMIFTFRGANSVALLGAGGTGSARTVTVPGGTSVNANSLIAGFVGTKYQDTSLDPFTSWVNATLASLTDRSGAGVDWFNHDQTIECFTGEKASAGTVNATTSGTDHPETGTLRWAAAHLEISP